MMKRLTVLGTSQMRRFPVSSHALRRVRPPIKSVPGCGDRATRFDATTSRRSHNLDKRPGVDEFRGKYSQKVRHRYKRTTGEGCAGTGRSHEHVGAGSVKTAVAA